jgi:hypothetical protein
VTEVSQVALPHLGVNRRSSTGAILSLWNGRPSRETPHDPIQAGGNSRAGPYYGRPLAGRCRHHVAGFLLQKGAPACSGPIGRSPSARSRFRRRMDRPAGVDAVRVYISAAC